MSFFIAIDGLDGSGKHTQTSLLCQWLREQGREVCALSFPCYGKKSAIPAEMYLNGELGGKPEDTNAFAASVLFSVDRYLSYRIDWKELADRKDAVIVSDRYSTANAVHQLSKMPRSEWESFLSWLWDFEFQKLGLPKPDLVLYLEMPPSVSRKLIVSRSEETGRKQDIHEMDFSHLEKSYAAALYAADALGWDTIHCAENGEPRSIPDIQEEIRAHVASALKNEDAIR
ncbi:MAG: thymidylate kinase [Clostridia bacterium]|nr:thymidylate kinase [Clostridia bacterium]MBQ4290152.1 thymidylate kinase [Clostridia bacterium]